MKSPWMRSLQCVPLCCAAWVGWFGPVLADEPALTFEQHIRPIFRAHCFDCHGATDDFKGKLDLRRVRSLRTGGESGAAIVPGQPEQSLLVERVRSGEMPPGKTKVSARELETIERWIATGARTARPEPETIGAGLGITDEERSFWSFRPIRRPEVRDPTNGPVESRVRSPIDALLLATPNSRLAPDADRRTLVRRAYFDLLGLPPSPEEMQRWLDAGDDWFDALLTELLASPHYGERWARHWLDIAGYADSDGYTVADAERPWVWKYRDWVIRALNADKPFDRFLAEQLAGDELAGPIAGDLSPEQIELLTATGFLRLAADGTGSGADNADARNQVLADTLKIVGTGLLGLSLQCAQCHDHRYDPIPQTDYYALRAVFEPALDWRAWKSPDARRVSLATAADRQRAAEIEAEVQQIAAEKSRKQSEYLLQALDKALEKFAEPLKSQLREAYQAGDKRTAEQKRLLASHPSVNITPGVLYQYLPAAADDLKKFDSRMAESRAKKPVEEFLHALIEPAQHLPETRLFFRGDHQQPRQPVLPAALTVTAPEGRRPEFPVDDPARPTTGRRLAFAQWLTSPDNPLFARVIVNRVWLHHFGRGLVATPADFGQLGARPSHPELLDWLADEFRRQGWSLKKLHRTILTSTTWRSVRSAERGRDTVPSSALAPLLRLDAEAIRDRMLAASGRLDRKLFGPPVGVKENETGQVVVDGEQTRRSLYIKVRRSRPVAMLQAFDAPVMETNCESRPSSTVATQSLMLLNGEFILDQAAKLADRAAAEPVTLPPEQLAGLPTAAERTDEVWHYGYGRFDEATNRTGSFARLPHWTGTQWQGGPSLPDAKLGWVLLSANGGHPDMADRAAIRRWTAPADGLVSIAGKLSHGSANGDGVRGRAVSSRSGTAGEWRAFNNATDTPVARLDVRAGDTLDFVVDCLASHTSDSFGWPVTVTLVPAGQTAGQAEQAFASSSLFRGPTPAPEALPGPIVRAWELALCRRPTPDELTLSLRFVDRQLATFRAAPSAVPSGRTPTRQALTNLCQSLLSSNEFLYVE